MHTVWHNPSPPSTHIQTVKISHTDPVLICIQTHTQCSQHKHRWKHTKQALPHFSNTHAPPHIHTSGLMHISTQNRHPRHTPTCHQLSEPRIHVNQAYIDTCHWTQKHYHTCRQQHIDITVEQQSSTHPPPPTSKHHHQLSAQDTHTPANSNPTQPWQHTHPKHPQKTLVSRD